MSNKKNKVAVLVAAGSGIGADAAKRLKEDGFKIAIFSSSGKGENLAKKLKGIGFTGSNLNNRDLKNFFNHEKPLDSELGKFWTMSIKILLS